MSRTRHKPRSTNRGLDNAGLKADAHRSRRLAERQALTNVDPEAPPEHIPGRNVEVSDRWAHD